MTNEEQQRARTLHEEAKAHINLLVRLIASGANMAVQVDEAGRVSSLRRQALELESR